MISIEEPMEEKILNRVYPVGAVYISFTATNPSTLFGGTWERIQDRFLLSSIGQSGQVGGEREHTLTINEMPKHNHGMYHRNAGVNGGTWQTLRTLRYNSDDVSATGQMQGGGKPHNNMPPYVTVYMWRRTA